MLKRTLRKKSAFWNIIKTGLAPTLCSVLVLCIVFLVVVTNATEAVNKAQEENITLAVRNTMDRYAEKAQAACQSISESTWFHTLFIDYALSNKSLTAIKKEEIFKTLSMITATYAPDMESLAFRFFWAPDTLFTNNGVYENLSFYREQYPDKREYEFYENRSDGFSVVNTADGDKLLYSAEISDKTNGRNKAGVNILFNSDRVENELLKATGGKIAGVKILDADGKTLCETSFENFEGEECIELPVNSEKMPVSYVISIPLSVDRKATTEAIPVFFYILLLDLVACILLIIYFSKRSYKPLKDTVLRYGKTTEGDVYEDEYETLNRIMGETFRDMEENKKALSEIYPMAKQALLNNILNGTAFIGERDGSLLSRCGIDFKYSRFNVICLQTDLAEIFNGNIEKDMEMQFAVAAQEVFASKAAEGLKLNAYLFVKSSGLFSIIVNFEDSLEFDAYLRELYKNSALIDRPDDDFGGVYAACGTSVDRARDVYIAADQAETALKHAVAFGKKGITYYDKKIMSDSLSFLYSVTQERLFAMTLAEGDAASVCEVIDAIVEANASSCGEVSSRLLYSAMCVTLLRAAQDQGIELKQLFSNDLPLSLGEASENLKKIASEFCSLLEGKNAAEATAEDSCILKYIDEHLYDADLSLNGIASIYGRSTTSISETFKKLTGFKYVDYVNRKRIERAIELMYEKNIEMNKVYSMVGYVSLSTFRRNYKKFAGTEQTGL